jgi:hypothetical protein
MFCTQLYDFQTNTLMQEPLNNIPNEMKLDSIDIIPETVISPETSDSELECITSLRIKIPRNSTYIKKPRIVRQHHIDTTTKKTQPVQTTKTHVQKKFRWCIHQIMHSKQGTLLSCKCNCP